MVRGEDAAFLQALLKLHPDPWWHPLHLIFYVEHEGPTIHHLWAKWDIQDPAAKSRVSWNQCLGLTQRTPKSDLLKAMRLAVADQRPNLPGACEMCRGAGPYHLDHHPLTFNTISKNFLLTRPAPTSFASNGKLGGVKFHSSDTLYELAWRSYHREHARYRKLCAPCNTSHLYESTP